jgi:hypothetical protein
MSCWRGRAPTGQRLASPDWRRALQSTRPMHRLSRKEGLSADHRRALQVLVAAPDGCTATLMLAHGFKLDLLSGYSRNAIVHQGRLDEGVELLQKPVGQAQLAARIRALLDRGRSSDE